MRPLAAGEALCVFPPGPLHRGCPAARRPNPRNGTMMRMRSISRAFTALLCVLLLQVGSIGCAQQPGPAPGPGPIAPGAGPQIPPEVSPPGKPTEVPIGRREGYNEEKRKAQEGAGQPPGAVQEDPAVRRRETEPKPGEGK